MIFAKARPYDEFHHTCEAMCDPAPALELVRLNLA